jgi:hypothetical protein
MKIMTQIQHVNAANLAEAREVNLRLMEVDDVRNEHEASGYIGYFRVCIGGEWIDNTELEERRNEGVNYQAYIAHAQILAWRWLDHRNQKEDRMDVARREAWKTED